MKFLCECRGVASAYNVPCKDGEVKHSDAYLPTFRRVLPLRWKHQQQIGIARLTHTSAAVEVERASFEVDDSIPEQAKMFKEFIGGAMKFSVGYVYENSRYIGDVLNVYRARLDEISLVSVAFNPAAILTSVSWERLPDHPAPQLASAATPALTAVNGAELSEKEQTEQVAEEIVQRITDGIIGRVLEITNQLATAEGVAALTERLRALESQSAVNQ